MDVGRRADLVMHQPGVGIHRDMGLHPEIPVVALLGLVHLGVSRAGAVLRRARRGDQRGIDHRAGLQHQTLGGERGVDRGEHLGGQAVFLQQVAEPQDRALVGQPHHALGQLRKLAEQRHVEKRLFHGRVRQAEPLLQEVDAQHRLDGKRRPAGLRSGAVRLDQRHKLRPRHNAVHLVEELALARLLRRQLQTQVRLLHAGDRPTSRPHVPLGSARGF